ncbi:hypothetical protein Tco_0492995 [Tanacetum coccineum]
MEKTQAESSLAKPNTDDAINIELNKEFLMELQSNAYHGMFDEDVIDHIAKVFEILDLVKTPYVDSHQLCMKVFPLSLANNARQWTSLEKKSTKLVKYESSGILLIREYLVKIRKKARILELKRRHLKIPTLTSYTPYPSRKIRRIHAHHKRPQRNKDQYAVSKRSLYAVFNLK